MHTHPVHLNGSRQPVTGLKLRFKSSLILDFERLDRFLIDGFTFDGFEFPKEHSVECPDVPRNLPKIVSRLSFLANALLQAVNVPSFEQAKPLAFKSLKSEGLWELNVAVPIILFFPKEIISSTYIFAAKIIEMFSTENKPTDAETLFQIIMDEFVDPRTGKYPGSRATILLLKFAYQKKIPFFHLGAGLYQLGWGVNSRRFDRFTIDGDTAIGRKIAINKRLSNSVLSMAGCPVPRQHQVYSAEQAVDAAKNIGFPVVIKPADRERGEGVFIDIMSDDMVRDAFEGVSKFTNLILVEEQISGVCHRIIVAGGEARVVIARHPVHVIGDGIHAISELVLQYNDLQKQRAPFLRRSPANLDDAAFALLKQNGMDKDTIPQKGQKVPFRYIESMADGGRAEDLLQTIHPDNVELAVKATRVCGLNVAGIDIMTDDISVPWYQNSAMINEINFAPSLGLKYPFYRAAVPGYLDELFPHGGRIPLIACIGSHAAFRKALDMQAEFKRKGKSYYICSPDKVLMPDGQRLETAAEYNQMSQLVALLLDKSTEAIILVVPSEEDLLTRLPIDHVDGKVQV